MKHRPYLSRVHIRAWHDKDHGTTPGIALQQGHRIAAHLTPEEAIELSNQLVDLVEELEAQR